MVPICCQAPTWTFVRLQPPEHQLYFVKVQTLDLGAPTFRTPSLPVLRHQPQGHQSFQFLRHQSFKFLRHQPQGNQSFQLLRHQPQGLRPNLVKACLIVMFCFQNFSLLSSVYLQLHCSLHATTSMETNLLMKESLQLFIYPHRVCNSHHDI